MTRSTILRGSLFAAPGLALAVVGATHPHSLSYPTSAHWTIIHLIGLLVFPLVGVALAAVVWTRRNLTAWIAIGGAYLYATSYTALDIVSGAAAGYVTYRLGPGKLRPDTVDYMFDLGAYLETVGAAALLIAAIFVGVTAVGRHGTSAVIPAVVLSVAGISFLDSHIFWWRGVVTVAAIGIATGWLAVLNASDHQSTSHHKVRAA